MVKSPCMPSTPSNTGFSLDRAKLEHISRVVSSPVIEDLWCPDMVGIVLCRYLISTGMVSAATRLGITL